MRYLFQGGRYQFGYYQFGLRDMSADRGRWLEQDPIGLAGGDVNLYRFASCNPVNRIDPSGMFDLLGNVNDGWFAQVSNWCAGVGDTVSMGATRYARQALNYDDAVNYNSTAYQIGTATGTAINIGLIFANPCAMGSVLSFGVRAVNAVQAIGGTMNAANNIAAGNYGMAALDVLGILGNVSQMTRACFTGDTKLMARGLWGEGWRRIDEISVDDEVLSRNENDLEGPLAWKQVEEVFERWAFVNELEIGGKTVKTTFEHPFYVQDKGWLEAGKLKEGDRIPGIDVTETVRVEGVAPAEGFVKVFNISVRDFHTYFVGDPGWGFSLWAHNAPSLVYRGLAEGEEVSKGLSARAPGAGNSVASHVAGKIQSQWISTSLEQSIAQTRFGKFGVVEIDLAKVTSEVVDISKGIPGMTGMLSNWAAKMKEVLVRDFIPADAIRRLM